MATAQTPYIKIIGEATLQKTVMEMLSHVYPGVRVTIAKEADLQKLSIDLLIIEQASISKEKIQNIISAVPEIPILIVVEDVGQAKSVRHLLSGRREIITRDELATSSLIHAVHHLRERQQLHEQLKKAAHKLKDLSIHDELTRLYNHRYFNEVLLQEFKKANRYKRPLGIIIIDLKNFASVNNAFGHAEGDRILAKTAGMIQSTIREVDIAARFGDNAFAVILPESDMAATVCAAERLNKALHPITNMHEKDSPKIAVCMGAAAVSDKVGSKEDLLRSALAALSESKKKGALCTGLDSNGARKEVKENRQLIEQLNERLTAIGREAEKNAFSAILKVINDVATHKKYLIAHAERVAFFAERLASSIEPINGISNTVYRAGLLHDIGKLAIDTQILAKDSYLTTEEMELLHQHPALGAQIVCNVSFLAKEAEFILNHHERYDGNGYPSGLKGNDIPLGARIIAITEAWDTMISPQPYRTTPLPLDEALTEIKKGAGTQFDPELVELFTSLITS